MSKANQMAGQEHARAEARIASRRAQKDPKVISDKNHRLTKRAAQPGDVECPQCSRMRSSTEACWWCGNNPIKQSEEKFIIQIGIEAPTVSGVASQILPNDVQMDLLKKGRDLLESEGYDTSGDMDVIDSGTDADLDWVVVHADLDQNFWDDLQREGYLNLVGDDITINSEMP